MMSVHPHMGLGQSRYGTAFGLFQVVKTGLFDSLSPGVITALVILIVFVFTSSRFSRFFNVAVGWFITGLLVTRCLMVLGGFDYLLNDRAFTKVLYLGHVALTLLAMTIGVLLLRDWWAWKFSGGQVPPNIRICRIRTNVLANFVCPRSISKILVGIITALPQVFIFSSAAFVSGVISAFLGSVWPENSGVWLILYEFIVLRNIVSGFVSLSVYGFFYILPVVLFWFFLAYLLKTKSSEPGFNKLLPTMQVVCSAICLGYSISILVFYL